MDRRVNVMDDFWLDFIVNIVEHWLYALVAVYFALSMCFHIHIRQLEISS